MTDVLAFSTSASALLSSVDALLDCSSAAHEVSENWTAQVLPLQRQLEALCQEEVAPLVDAELAQLARRRR